MAQRIDPSTLEVGDLIAVMHPVDIDGSYTWTEGKVTKSIANPDKPNLFSFHITDVYVTDFILSRKVSTHWIDPEVETAPSFSSLTDPFIMVFKRDH